MSMLEQIREQLPDYAKDIRLNLSSVLQPAPGMTEKQLWGSAVACAMATRNQTLLHAVLETARTRLSDAEINAARIAATLMSMNNVYYRFLGLVGKEDYARQPAGLRMNGMANPGADKIDFELWSLAVSAINGCGHCIVAHEKKLAEHGITQDVIRHAVRIAAVLQATAIVMETESVGDAEASPAEAA